MMFDNLHGEFRDGYICLMTIHLDIIKCNIFKVYASQWRVDIIGVNRVRSHLLSHIT